MKTKNLEIYKSTTLLCPYYIPSFAQLSVLPRGSREVARSEYVGPEEAWQTRRVGGGGERMENEYVVPWDRGVDRFLGGEDVMVYTVREHEAHVGLGGSTLQYGGGEVA